MANLSVGDEMSMIKQTEIIDDEKTKFLLAMAHSIAGGYPAIGIRQEGDVPDYIIAPTCSCAECQSYLAATQAVANTSIIEAVKRYVDTRLSWEKQNAEGQQTKH